MEKKIITFEEIKKEYEEICFIMQNVKTIEQVKLIKEITKLYLEVNGDEVSRFKDDDLVEWIRVENYKNLCYIYFYTDGTIIFDIYDDEQGLTIFDGGTIEKAKTFFNNVDRQIAIEKVDEFYGVSIGESFENAQDSKVLLDGIKTKEMAIEFAELFAKEYETEKEILIW